MPRHGGQRRVAAIRQAYSDAGVTYKYVCVYDTRAYDRSTVDVDDIPVTPRSFKRFAKLPLLFDMQAGFAVVDDDEHFNRLLRVVEQFSPTHIELEQPFLFPFVERLLAGDATLQFDLVYSSQNFEAPLKEQMLLTAGVPVEKAREVRAAVEALESSLVSAAALILCSSTTDADTYRAMGHRSVLLCRNGVDVAPVDQDALRNLLNVFEGRTFLAALGSAYPPNIRGVVKYLIAGGAFYIPPQKRFAVVGGMSRAVGADPEYQKCERGHRERFHFMPDVSEGELGAVRTACHGYLLPIEFGGGSNLKTAEAIFGGKWIVATRHALRGFEEFMSEPGVIIEDDPRAYRLAIQDVLSRSPLELTSAASERRKAVDWRNSLAPLRQWAAAADSVDSDAPSRGRQ